MRGLLLLVPWRPPQRTSLRRGMAGRNRPAARAKSIPRPGDHTRPPTRQGSGNCRERHSLQGRRRDASSSAPNARETNRFRGTVMIAPWT